ATAPPRAPTPPTVGDPKRIGVTGVYNIFLAGIGGTGIVTVNQVLGMAALRAGLHVEGLDQTGLSQKAGPVTSHLRLSAAPVDRSNRVSPGTATRTEPSRSRRPARRQPGTWSTTARWRIRPATHCCRGWTCDPKRSPP